MGCGSSKQNREPKLLIKVDNQKKQESKEIEVKIIKIMLIRRCSRR